MPSRKPATDRRAFRHPRLRDRHIPVIQSITRIADRYFDTGDATRARIWPFPAFGASEKSVAIGMVVFLVLLNQMEVGVSVRLSFFSRDMYNALQDKNAAAFWFQIFLVFTPFAFLDVASACHRIYRTIDPHHSLAALAHQQLCRPLARQPHPLPHVAGRRRRRQPRSTYLGGHQPLH